jgi:hypothetical protein
MSRVLLVILVLYQNGMSVGRAITAPTMHDCRAARPAIEQSYRDAPDALGWEVQDVKSICMEFE